MEPLSAFRALAPEYVAKTDDQVNIMLELAKPHVSTERFGSFYAQALAYYAAHLFSSQAQVQAYGSTSAAVTAGAVTSEREGDLQRSYAQGAKDITPLDRTSYGQEFKALAKRCVIPALTRM